MVDSYRILTHISTEHFLNTTPRGFFRWVGRSSGLNLKNPKWNMISHRKFPFIIFECVVYATTDISSYLGQSTREVRKLKYCVWARWVKRSYGQRLYTSFLVISDKCCNATHPYPHPPPPPPQLGFIPNMTYTFFLESDINFPQDNKTK